MPSRATTLAAVAVAIGLATAGVLAWVATSGPPAVDCNPSGSGNTPLGSSFAIGTPTEASQGSSHWYNFSIQTGMPSLHLDNLNFQVQDSSGGIVSPGAAWTLQVRNVTGGWIGMYSLVGAAAGTWIDGGSFPIYSQEMISLLTSPQNLSGDNLIVLLSGSYSNGCPLLGSVSVAIP